MSPWQLQRSTTSHSTHMALLASLPGTGDSANQDQDGIHPLGNTRGIDQRRCRLGTKSLGSSATRY